MNVTRQTLRDMILAEIESVDEDAIVPRTSDHGLTGQELATMPAEDVEGILRQKAGGLSSKMAKFISAMVDAGWDRDQLIRNLAGMDDDVLVTLLAPAMRESYDKAVQLLAEAIVNSSDEGRIIAAWMGISAEELKSDDFVRIMGLFQDDHPGRPAEELDGWLTNMLKPELDDMLGAFGDKFNVTPASGLDLLFAYKLDKEQDKPGGDLPPTGWLADMDIIRHQGLGIIHPADWGRIEFKIDITQPDDEPEEWEASPRDQALGLDETTLMTVGQFRRLVREAATAVSSRDAASNDVGALFARILKVEDEKQKNDLLNRLDNAGQDIGQRDEIAAELLDIEEPVSDFIHPAEDQHRSMERLEQLRKESDDILKKLLSNMSSEIILLKLRRLVYNDDSSSERLAKWMEDQAMGIPDDALLKNWLDEIGPEEAYDDLAELEDELMKGSSMEERINRGIDSLKQ
jgi:hypothetical protein